jgi:hypothetical protein
MGMWNRNKLKESIDWSKTNKDPRLSMARELVMHRTRLHFF